MNQNTLDSITLRLLTSGEEEFLKEMLFEAIFLPPEEKLKLPKNIISHPDLKKYYEHWGQRGDIAVVAALADTNRLLGCAWGRLFTSDEKGYGFISEQIPELSLAVHLEFRDRGIGTMLIRRIIEEYELLGYRKLSLSVSKDNPGFRLYRREKFRIFSENEKDFIMMYNKDIREQV